MSIAPFQELTFVGGGHMASAIIAGIETMGSPPRICICDPDQNVRARHEDRGRATLASVAMASSPGAVCLAFKPQNWSGLFDELDASLAHDALVISIMAGIETKSIADALPGRRIVRVMPNMPIALGKGMSGYCAGKGATERDLEFVAEIFGAGGKTLRVDECRINDLSTISGSGPAYFYRFCEAFVSAAKHLGFSDADSALLVRETALGAIAALEAQKQFSPSALRIAVTSKGGSTAEALRVFEERKLDAIFADAVDAATSRATDLAKESG